VRRGNGEHSSHFTKALERRQEDRVKSTFLPLAFVLALTAPLQASSPEPPQTTVAKAAPGFSGGRDPFLWLEDKDGARAMAWVRAQNARSLPVLQRDPHYATFYKQALKISESTDRIAYPTTLHGEIYNFWQDGVHVRGIWRKTSLASYRSSNPHWTTVLDLDALSAAEHANWVWKGFDCIEPQEDRCMISLSDGGEDAVTEREFDLASDRFVNGGFVLTRQKQNSAWVDENTLLVARAWQPGEQTTSGYPYDVREIKRGQPLSAAVEIFSGKPSDVAVSPFVMHDGSGNEAVLISRGVTFFTSEISLLTPKGVQLLNLPLKNEIDGMVDGEILVKLDQDWTAGGASFKQGSLVEIPLTDASAHPSSLSPRLVYAPASHEALEGLSVTKNGLIMTVLDDVRGRAYVYAPKPGGTWAKRALNVPDMSAIGLVDTNLRNDRVFFNVTGFLTPTTLYLADAGSAAPPIKIKTLPAQFDGSNDLVEQHFAVSKDGTKIPYFIVRPKNMRFDGRNPAVLNAYGGFLSSSTPFYSGVLGKLWLERGGVFVLANIRGGGEYGPAWHDAGLTIHRQRIYDDFFAVGKDLVTRKVTDPRHLGIVGGSNGGLLMGVEFTQHPEMWNAVQIEVPLLDMIRYEKIEAGASWAGEYGSISDPAARAFWLKTSPYQNLTTTKDDRVGPQHARKFAAKLAAMHVPYLYYEVTEGGHGAGANLKESAKTNALGWTYFTMKLME
jgi:prolyl oligopeptidase